MSPDSTRSVLPTVLRWCGTVLGCYILAFALSPSDPFTTWLYFALLSTLVVLLLCYFRVLPCRFPRQFSIRALFGVFVVLAIVLAALTPYFRDEQVITSSDNVVAFSDESICDRAKCIRRIKYTMPSGATVEFEPIHHAKTRRVSPNCLIARITVRWRLSPWGHARRNGDEWLGPGTRDEFVRILESEIASALGTQDTASVMKLTLRRSSVKGGHS